MKVLIEVELRKVGRRHADDEEVARELSDAICALDTIDGDDVWEYEIVDATWRPSWTVAVLER